MNTSSRLLVSLAAVAAAVTLSTLAIAASASASPAKPIVPDPVATLGPSYPYLLPKVTVTTTPSSIVRVGQYVTATVTANWGNGAALPGDISVDLLTASGPIHLAGSAALYYHTGQNFTQLATAPGTISFRATYTPTPGTLGASASATATVQERIDGFPGLTIAASKAVAGSTTPVVLTLALPGAGAAYPVGGDIRLDVDGTNGLASCTPVRTSNTAAACTANLPGSVTKGTHSLTATFENSPTFLNASTVSPLTVAAAPAPSSTMSGSSTTSTVPPTASASPSASPDAAAATPTADAAGAATSNGSDPTAHAVPVSAATSPVPLWGGIALAILLLAFVVIAVLVTVAIVRSRRARVAS